MIGTWPLIAIAVGVTLVAFAVVTLIVNRKKERREPDYRTFFIIGCSWIPLGIATKNSAFWIMGIVFMIIGLVNKEKWKKEKKLSELDPKERMFKIVTISILGAMVLLGLVAFLLV